MGLFDKPNEPKWVFDEAGEPDYAKIRLRPVQEQIIRKSIVSAATQKCHDLFKEYDFCINYFAVQSGWKCRTQLHLLNDCLDQYTTADDFARARKEYVLGDKFQAVSLDVEEERRAAENIPRPAPKKKVDFEQ